MSDARSHEASPTAPRADVIPVPAVPRVDVRGGGRFPVHRIYCVGRNFADHAREMGAVAPASKDERGTPVFFMKPADAIVTGEVVAYPPGTADLHHEVELVVAIGHDAPPGVRSPGEGRSAAARRRYSRRENQQTGRHHVVGPSDS